MVNPIENNNKSKSYPLQPRNTNTGGKHTSVCPMCAISKKHNIALPDSVIMKLNAERVVESGEFEFLDSARLSKIGIKSKEDRIKVLKLVKMYNNKELAEFRNQFDKAYTRSQLQAHIFSLLQQRLSLVIQMPDPENRVWYSCTLNCFEAFHGQVAENITDGFMQLIVEVIEEALSGLQELKLREKEEGNVFFRGDPVLRREIKSLIAQSIARRKEKCF